MDLKKFFNDFYESSNLEDKFDEKQTCPFEAKARDILERKKLEDLKKLFSIDFNENLNYDEYLKYQNINLENFKVNLKKHVNNMFEVHIQENKEGINMVNKMRYKYLKWVDLSRDSRFNQLGLNYKSMDGEDVKFLIKFLYKQKDLDIFN